MSVGRGCVTKWCTLQHYIIVDTIRIYAEFSIRMVHSTWKRIDAHVKEVELSSLVGKLFSGKLATSTVL